MSAKLFCLVPPRWTLHDYSLHTCSDRSHSHLSRSQVYDFEKHGSINWIAIRYADRQLIPTSKPDVSKKWLGGIVRISRSFKFRGLSSDVGAYLAENIRRGESWALAMLDQIENEFTRGSLPGAPIFSAENPTIGGIL